MWYWTHTRKSTRNNTISQCIIYIHNIKAGKKKKQLNSSTGKRDCVKAVSVALYRSTYTYATHIHNLSACKYVKMYNYIFYMYIYIQHICVLSGEFEISVNPNAFLSRV